MASVDNTPSSTLEGITPTVVYYDSTGSPLPGAPSKAGTYSVTASFTGSAHYSSASATTAFTIGKAIPRLSIQGSGGTYNGTPSAVTDSVAGVVTGVDDTPSDSLEGIAPTLSYYDSTGNALSGPPAGTGDYSILATFPGSTDYTSATASAAFETGKTWPTVALTDAGGTFNGSAYPAMATVAGIITGVDDTPAPSLEGVLLGVMYEDVFSHTIVGAPSQAGTYAVTATFPGSTDYSAVSVGVTFVISPATPTIMVTDASGGYTGLPFAATTTIAGVVAGVDDSPGGSLEGVVPSLTYYDATGSALPSAPTQLGTYNVAATFPGST
ncbi:MAG TPA: hypothetical protein VFD32_01770, partial [Dehalococcoidia bacterium]|nr:hypothetical protein [Dehalococcoidia bacterium]